MYRGTMRLWNVERPLLVTCGRAIAPYLKKEIVELGLPVRAESAAAVETEGTLAEAIRLNLCLRTGQHVLFLIEEFRARSLEDLYAEASRIAWEEYVPAAGYVSVTSSVHTPAVRDARMANLTCKDALVDRIRKRRGIRPDSGPTRSRTVVSLFWKGDNCRIYLDTSGAPLSRRGYRRIPLEAPMQETLAAAVVIATGWEGQGTFVNPMCGTGTLAIEACLLALGRAPGLLRNTFGFMHILGFEPELYRDIRAGLRRASRTSFPGKIIATDKSPRAIETAKRHAATAGVARHIEFVACDFAETPIPEPRGTGGVVVLNPEYGKRMGEAERLSAMYSAVGDFLKKRCQGYRGYILTGNLDLAKKVGLRTCRRIPFFNGPIECRLLEYDLYPGSRKATKQSVAAQRV